MSRPPLRQVLAEDAVLRNKIKELQEQLDAFTKLVDPQSYEGVRCQKHGIMGCMPCRFGEPTQAPTWEELNKKVKDLKKHYLQVLLRIKGSLDWFGRSPTYELNVPLGNFDGQVLRMKQIIDKEFPVNQCDGCMAGIPIDENGNHRMGEPDGYPNLQACEKSKYINAG